MLSAHWRSSMVRGPICALEARSNVYISVEMHPLAIEDVLSQRQHSRSKADYYPQHLFLRILCHTRTTEDYQTPDSSVTRLPRPEHPDPIDIDESEDEEDFQPPDDDRTMYGSVNPSRFSSTKRESLENAATKINEAKDIERSAIQQLRLLQRPATDNTVCSIHLEPLRQGMLT